MTAAAHALLGRRGARIARAVPALTSGGGRGALRPELTHHQEPSVTTWRILIAAACLAMLVGTPLPHLDSDRRPLWKDREEHLGLRRVAHAGSSYGRGRRWRQRSTVSTGPEIASWSSARIPRRRTTPRIGSGRTWSRLTRARSLRPGASSESSSSWRRTWARASTRSGTLWCCCKRRWAGGWSQTVDRYPGDDRVCEPISSG